ncbi:DUF6458 family protein [Microbacterium sp. NPDC008134]|uniref:DUF6458 family protein n=1 Tax=Microbacterium sp. NPDC008134 TaxID=3364183 RepID=UPI0036E6AE92
MSIGTGIFLFVVGAILTFALEVRLDWIDLDLVGYILMAAGVLIFLIGIILLITRRSRARGATATTVVDDDRV